MRKPTREEVLKVLYEDCEDTRCVIADKIMSLIEDTPPMWEEELDRLYNAFGEHGLTLKVREFIREKLREFAEEVRINGVTHSIREKWGL